MAVCAPDGALCDLGLDCIPTQAILNHDCDARAFLRRDDVVEIENNRIVLRAVDARVLAEKRQHPIGRFMMPQLVSSYRLEDVVRLVSQVVIANVLSTTRPAIRLKSTFRSVAPVELSHV